MITDALLRESAPDATAMRAHTERVGSHVLERATAAQPRLRSRRRPALGAALGAVLSLGALGGVAYAAGGVPPLVSSIVDDFGDQSGLPVEARPEMAQIADLTLPDGSRFAVWHGSSESMACTFYIDNWDGKQPTGTGGGMCGDTPVDADSPIIAWAQAADGSTYYPVLFGVADRAAQVQVSGTFTGTGAPVDLSMPVDPGNGAYAAVLPGTNDDPWGYLDDIEMFRASEVTLRFIDGDGHLLRTVEGPPA